MDKSAAFTLAPRLSNLLGLYLELFVTGAADTTAFVSDKDSIWADRVRIAARRALNRSGAGNRVGGGCCAADWPPGR